MLVVDEIHLNLYVNRDLEFIMHGDEYKQLRFKLVVKISLGTQNILQICLV